MRHHFSALSIRIAVAAQVAMAPYRMLTVRDYWREFNEPSDLLYDAEATYLEDGRSLAKECKAQGIAFQQKPELRFPVWALAAFYSDI